MTDLGRWKRYLRCDECGADEGCCCRDEGDEPTTLCPGRPMRLRDKLPVCSRGHLKTGENLAVHGGVPRCRECQRLNRQRNRKRHSQTEVTA